jgi:hypothetical protein
MTEFTALVATAVANAQSRGALEASRDELARLPLSSSAADWSTAIPAGR